ncbi:MAG: hypothetical protein J0L97_00320 [Alphaproteobacteria bacterium]|nr:hypothetical protein [Alphaproteobacteria bacterium]
MTFSNPYFNNHIFRGKPTGDILYGEEGSDMLSECTYGQDKADTKKSKKPLPSNVSATIASVLRHIG